MRQSCSCEERGGQPRLPANAPEGQVELFMELFEVEASQVGHFHLLEVTPEPFHRIEVRRVCWQPLQLQTVRSHGSDILVHQSPSVDGRAIPDHQYRPL